MQAFHILPGHLLLLYLEAEAENEYILEIAADKE